MRYGSICSGVEAASLAWKPLGWEAAFFAEVEPFPCAVLMQKFNATRPLRPLDPEDAASLKERKQRESWQRAIAKLPDGGSIKNLGDFTKIGKEDYEGDIDLLVGGTSCQSFSVAGLRKGLEDPRGNLALEFARLAYRTGAKLLLWENVPGVLSSNGGTDFASFLSLLCGWEVEVPVAGKSKGKVVRRWRNSGIITPAPGGYGLAWRTMDAQFVRVEPGFCRAVPQRRRRLFLVGSAGNWERAAAVLFEPGCFGRNPEPRRQARQRTACGFEVGPAGGRQSDVSATLDAKCKDGAVRNQTGMLCMSSGQSRAEVCKDKSPTLNCNHEVPLVCRESGQGFCLEDEVSGTVKVNGAEPTTVVCYDARGLGDGNVSPNITGDHAARTNDYMPVIVENKKAFGFLPEQGSKAGSAGFEDELAPARRRGCDAYGVLSFGSVQRTAEVPLQTPVAKAPCGSGNPEQQSSDVSFGIAENIIGRQEQNGGNGSGVSKDVQFTLNATGVHGVCCFTQNDGGLDCSDNLPPTLRSGGSDDGAITQAVASYGTVRRLMPIETERLMGFPDGHTQIEWKGKPKEQCPDGPRYKVCGNSMCVNVMRWLGMRIQMTEHFF